MSFIYDLNLLLPGDVILKRSPGNYISDRVMSSTKSIYSHAMIYMGDSSYIDVGKRVQARNLQRYIFETPDDTCLLRLNKDDWKGCVIEKVVEYARNVVANPYSIRDALNLEEGRVSTYTENTQICTRLVSKAYEYAGLKIVEQVEMCTPQEILKSKYFNIVNCCYREASDFDLRFASSYDVSNDMIAATDALIVALNVYGNGNLRSIESITNYAINHPNEDKQIAEILKCSGYLNIMDLDRKYNKYNYEVKDFLSFYGRNYVSAALQLIQSNIEKKEMYERELKKYLMMQRLVNFHSQYLDLQIGLYRDIIKACKDRYEVGLLSLQYSIK